MEVGHGVAAIIVAKMQQLHVVRIVHKLRSLAFFGASAGCDSTVKEKSPPPLMATCRHTTPTPLQGTAFRRY